MRIKHTATVDSSVSSSVPLIDRFIGLSVTGSITFIIILWCCGNVRSEDVCCWNTAQHRVALEALLRFCYQYCVNLTKRVRNTPVQSYRGRVTSCVTSVKEENPRPACYWEISSYISPHFLTIFRDVVRRRETKEADFAHGCQKRSLSTDSQTNSGYTWTLSLEGTQR